MMRSAVLCLALLAWNSPQQTSRIAGVIVDGSGAPVGRALVALTSADLAGPRTVISADDGRFEFGDLPSGRFRLQARKAFHRDVEFGQRAEGDIPTRIRLTQGQQLTDLRVTLPRLSSIQGWFVDTAGRMTPVARHPERSLGPEIRRRHAGVSIKERVGVSLDGRGGFSVQRLSAGTYELRASRHSPPIDVVVGEGEHVTDVLLPTAEADAVEITGTLTGVVLDVDGKPMKDVQFRLMSLETEPPEDHHDPYASDPDEQGHFTLPDIPVGRYRLLAKAAVFSGSGQASTFRSFWASTEVVVTPGGAFASLTLRQGVMVSGQVMFGDSTLTAPAFPNVWVSLVPQEGRAALSADVPGNVPGGQVATDGTFAIWSVPPGRYTVSVHAYDGRTNLGEGWIVESAIRNGVDVQDVLLTVGAEDVGDIAVRMVDQAAAIEGTVRDDAGAFVFDRTVVVFPTESDAWRAGARKIRAVRPDTSGTFEVTGLLRGEYFVAAVNHIEPLSWFDPKVLSVLRESARRITLGEGGDRKVVDLRVR